MTDSAHDRDHVYRGLYLALDIAARESGVDFDILIPACLLHDIARTIFYKGQLSEPLYTLREDGSVSDGSDDDAPSFFQEYKLKLENIYDRFYTDRAKEIAADRQKSATSFYNSMLSEVAVCYQNRGLLEGLLE
jgi:hypothetical protein